MCLFLLKGMNWYVILKTYIFFMRNGKNSYSWISPPACYSSFWSLDAWNDWWDILDPEGYNVLLAEHENVRQLGLVRLHLTGESRRGVDHMVHCQIIQPTEYLSRIYFPVLDVTYYGLFPALHALHFLYIVIHWVCNIYVHCLCHCIFSATIYL